MGSKTFSEIGVLGLYTETALHCGAEGGTGYVDLPIQRERHTQYPVIPGSTVKGVLRDELKDLLGQPEVDRIFGKSDAKSPGCVSFGDGILVAFPVRSSEAPFQWVTSPFVLERVSRSLGAALKVDEPSSGAAWARGGDKVLLEEIRLRREPLEDFFAEDEQSGLGHLLRLLPGEDRNFAYTRKIFGQRLLIVSDTDLKELVETATEVVTRIMLNKLGTTAKIPDDQYTEIEGPNQGNLFVEELVPPEALFLCPLRAAGGSEPELVKALRARPVIRLGGDETIGRGVTHMSFVPTNGEEA